MASHDNLRVQRRDIGFSAKTRMGIERNEAKKVIVVDQKTPMPENVRVECDKNDLICRIRCYTITCRLLLNKLHWHMQAVVSPFGSVRSSALFLPTTTTIDSVHLLSLDNSLDTDERVFRTDGVDDENAEEDVPRWHISQLVQQRR